MNRIQSIQCSSPSRERLVSILSPYRSLLVAYSGGIDSTFLLKAARDVIGERVYGVLGYSPSLAEKELTQALDVARSMGCPVWVLPTYELEKPGYVRNAPDRCFFCKEELFNRMNTLRKQLSFEALAYGENASDEGTFRPGRDAAKQAGVVAPLAQAGLTKEDVRRYSAALGLPNTDKPASPCLASRIPHGTPVSAEALARIDRAEAALSSLGFRSCRVRYHDSLARIELPPEEQSRLTDPFLRKNIVEKVRAAGFDQVTLDLAGYRPAHTQVPQPLEMKKQHGSFHGDEAPHPIQLEYYKI